jgi:tricorn protease
MKARTSAVFVEKVRDYWVSANGKKLMYQAGTPPTFAIVDVDKPPQPDDGKLNLDAAEILVDPHAEWQQIFQEAYRIHRDYFYDPHMHGLNWQATAEKYRAFLAHLGHRDDLNYLLAELSGELVVGHAYVGMGDIPAPKPVQVGLLGADYEVVDGAYRIQRIYAGLNWQPELRAPLTEPGVNVRVGEYILAVNGRTLRAPTSIYQLFEQTADRITELRVSTTPDEADARNVTVRPIDDESRLRHWSWVEQNRRMVGQLSGGRVAYIYMADTGQIGYEAFNRYYFSQLDKQAVVLDERFNGGGKVADYVVDLLNRPVLSHWATREGRPFSSPNASIFGPKVMIINELSGSGGDALPLFFRRRGLGTLVGKRTWGGLIGIYDYPTLIDGGMFTSPRLAIYSPDGQWEVENEGVAPDIEIEMTPKLVIEGHDPQLEQAVALVLAELERAPRAMALRPAPVQRAVITKPSAERE